MKAMTHVIDEYDRTNAHSSSISKNWVEYEHANEWEGLHHINKKGSFMTVGFIKKPKK